MNPMLRDWLEARGMTKEQYDADPQAQQDYLWGDGAPSYEMAVGGWARNDARHERQVADMASDWGMC